MNAKQAEKAIRLATIAPIALTTEHAPSDTASKKLVASLNKNDSNYSLFGLMLNVLPT